jgi:hypothetical protein
MCAIATHGHVVLVYRVARPVVVPAGRLQRECNSSVIVPAYTGRLGNTKHNSIIVRRQHAQVV